MYAVPSSLLIEVLMSLVDEDRNLVNGRQVEKGFSLIKVARIYFPLTMDMPVLLAMADVQLALIEDDIIQI